MAIAAEALSTESASEEAIRDVLDRVGRHFEGGRANLALVFASPHHLEAMPTIADRLREQDLADCVIGCSAESILGEGREVETGPALVLWALRMPGIRARPFRADSPEVIASLDIGPPDGTSPTRAMILLGDPYSFPAEDWIGAMNSRHPGLPVVGGMASAANAPGENRLILDGETVRDGAVGILIDGPALLRTVVSQGCRPIGRPMIVTKSDRNVILELGRVPAVEVLKELLESLAPGEMDRVRQGLHLGRVMSEYRDSFGRGDFLVRNVIGVDPRGGVAVADHIRVGQTVQFHVRDAESADEDLRELLDRSGAGSPVAGLLFTCNGRGSRLFGTPDHDASVLADRLGPIPITGFFAMGELGPVSGHNYLHGFTASVLLFEPPGP
ncbi:FIST signal transduction protein [Tautonia plasticadhaerens]|uniref:FIST N domain protein n=1 Tax=Tautonia plasticadhaerens TaxID=2527974 RepID=A0A518H8A6_9BACT|nr:FIST N-terminal domain-containing protein [Tautonia plasticadhaerens]QDV37092.1 FIST N domain protein [Tautonia plasticadhaerens]